MKKILLCFLLMTGFAHFAYAVGYYYTITRKDHIGSITNSAERYFDNASEAQYYYAQKLSNRCTGSGTPRSYTCDLTKSDDADGGRRFWTLTHCTNYVETHMSVNTASCKSVTNEGALLTCATGYTWKKPSKGVIACYKTYTITQKDPLTTAKGSGSNYTSLGGGTNAFSGPEEISTKPAEIDWPCTVQNVKNSSFDCVKTGGKTFWSTERCENYKKLVGNTDSAAECKTVYGGAELTCKSGFTWNTGTYNPSCTRTITFVQKDDGHTTTLTNFLITETPQEYAKKYNDAHGKTVCTVSGSTVTCSLTGNNFWDAAGYSGYITAKGLSANSVEMTNSGSGYAGVVHAHCKNNLDVTDPLIVENNGVCAVKVDQVYTDDNTWENIDSNPTYFTTNPVDQAISRYMSAMVSSMTTLGKMKVNCSYSNGQITCRFNNFMTKGRCEDYISPESDMSVCVKTATAAPNVAGSDGFIYEKRGLASCPSGLHRSSDKCCCVKD